MVSSSRSRQRRTALWAVAGGIVLAGAIGAVLLAPLFTGQQDGAKTPQPSVSASAPASAGTPPTSQGAPVVDNTVTQRGWIPEPVTQDEDLYIRAAMEAGSTFDTTLSTRSEFRDHLATWFTPDTRWAEQADRERALRQNLTELDQSVIFPDQMWDDLARENGRVAAEVVGEISYRSVPDPAGGQDATREDMFIGSADVVLSFTRAGDASGSEEQSYDQRGRVSVQVLCGDEPVPAPGSTQRPGDCKVVRYFGPES